MPPTVVDLAVSSYNRTDILYLKVPCGVFDLFQYYRIGFENVFTKGRKCIQHTFIRLQGCMCERDTECTLFVYK